MENKYGGFKKLALNKIEKYGVGMTLKRSTLTGDTNKPWEPPTVQETSYTCFGLILEYDAREIDGIVIKRDDRKIMVASESLSTAPTTSDVIEVGSVSYSIQNIASLAPSNDPIMYTLQVRNV